MNEQDKAKRLLALYEADSPIASMYAHECGLDPREMKLSYKMRDALTGWKLGVKDGKEEAAGKKSPPGALKLAFLKMLHGSSYVMGRQKALSAAGLSGGTTAPTTVRDVISKTKKEVPLPFDAGVCCDKPKEEPKLAAGTYMCPECKCAEITYHTPQDKYKLRCPKCNADMVLKPAATRIAIPLNFDNMSRDENA